MNSNCLTDRERALVSPEFLENPYPALHRLREEAPVYWSDTIGGWLLTRYDDIIATFKDVQHFSNEGRLARAVEYLPPEQRSGFAAFEDHYHTKGLLHSDPPDHTRLRTLVTKAFSPRLVEKIRSRIQELVDGMLDAVEKTGQADLVPDLAAPLPAIVIAEIFGAPVEDRRWFKQWADDLLAFQGINRPDIAILEQAQRSLLDLKAYLRELVVERQREPRDDLLSQPVPAESQGDKLSEAELINTSVTLLVAGHETTISLVGNGLFTLLRNPDQLERLRDRRNPALRKPRIAATASHQRRGCPVRKGAA